MNKFAILIYLFAALNLMAANDPAQKFLNLPGIKFRILDTDSGFVAGYELLLSQPLDHFTAHTDSFRQRIHIALRAENAPTVLITEGYAFGRNHTRELSLLLQANEVRVEHRYFGQSKPDSLDWSYLNLRQATADYHRIYELLKTVLPGRWLSTGWSKGGQTAACYRYYFPADMQATVCYDAPFNLEREEKSIDRFFSKVGDERTRQKIKSFQKLALKRKADLLPLMQVAAEQRQLTFSIGLQAALEYMILEYPFSFWQYHKMVAEDIPDNKAFPKEIFNHLISVVSMSSYSDRALDAASMYQFFTELGYYGYVQEGMQPWLSGAYDYSNAVFAPRDSELRFNDTLMPKIIKWLTTKNHRTLYLYGARDPWSAPAVKLQNSAAGRVLFLEGGNHFTFLNTFPDAQKKEALKLLQRWMKE